MASTQWWEISFLCTFRFGEIQKIQSVEKNINKSVEEINDLYYSHFYQKIGLSPRFKSHTRCNHQSNLEQQTSCFWDYLSIIGDYESMIILLPFPPKNCPSVNIDSIKQYVLFKFLLKNEPLVVNSKNVKTFEFSNNKHELSKSLNSIGKTKNPDGFKGFYSALNIIHIYNLHDGNYRGICSNCYNYVYNTHCYNKSKCDHHEHNIYYRCTGNPTQHFSIGDLKKFVKNIAVERGYRSRSRQPILPSDVKDFHDFVKALHYDNEALSYYVIVLFAIKYGLRFTGFSELNFDKFERNHRLWKFSDGLLNYLVVSIKEKHDKIPTLYKVPFIDSHPHSCLLRHLLILIHMLPYDEGYLLPSNVNNPLQMITEDKCAAYFQNICDKVFRHGGKEKINFGNQTFRVSYYLFGVLGFGGFAELRDNGRHKTDSMASKYFQDSRSLLDIINNDPVLLMEQTVPEFKNLILHDCGDNLKRLHLFQNATLPVNNLRECATLFVEQMLGINPESPHYKNPQYLLEKSYNMNFNKDQVDGNNLNNILSSFGLNDTKTKQIKYFINSFISRSLSNTHNGIRNGDVNSENDANLNDAINNSHNSENASTTHNNNVIHGTKMNNFNNNVNSRNNHHNNTENVVINNNNFTLQQVTNNNNNSNINNNHNNTHCSNEYNNSVGYNVNNNFNDRRFWHLLYPNNFFVHDINFNYLSSSSFPTVDVTCFEVISDRHNKTGLKLKKSYLSI